MGVCVSVTCGGRISAPGLGGCWITCGRGQRARRHGPPGPLPAPHRGPRPGRTRRMGQAPRRHHQELCGQTGCSKATRGALRSQPRGPCSEPAGVGGPSLASAQVTWAYTPRHSTGTEGVRQCPPCRTAGLWTMRRFGTGGPDRTLPPCVQTWEAEAPCSTRPVSCPGARAAPLTQLHSRGPTRQTSGSPASAPPESAPSGATGTTALRPPQTHGSRPIQRASLATCRGRSTGSSSPEQGSKHPLLTRSPTGSVRERYHKRSMAQCRDTRTCLASIFSLPSNKIFLTQKNKSNCPSNLTLPRAEPQNNEPPEPAVPAPGKPQAPKPLRAGPSPQSHQALPDAPNALACARTGSCFSPGTRSG